MTAASGPAAADSEFVFELQVCRWAERVWPPGGTREETAVLVARQLGTRDRRWDTVVVEADPAAFERRARFGLERLDGDLLHVVRNAPAEWAWYRDALPDPGYPWRYVREAVHRAADRGVLDTRKQGGRIECRRRFAYPDWVRRIVAIENKPDLDASAARALTDQIERDVALSLADEVWVATRATDDPVPPVLLEDLPVEAGVLAVDTRGRTTASVEWYAASLGVGDPGTKILDRPDRGGRTGDGAGGGYDRSAARFEYVDPAEKHDTRALVAERAYERGFRAYVDAMRPDCRQFDLRAVDRDGTTLPYCRAKGCHQTSGECSGSCPEFEPEPPAWRTRGWPIEGGPGALYRSVLERRRRRRRPGLDES